mmetsp:Transcript_19845/g.32927  ORF Transcript_19845/g.32927 Transcript_19845/m.32927 type:complete len:208 (-) Transcript_19845:1383-2006(-)|eukprot:CAMPEP_0119013084 /NCGR_PEP_ID=MMETSP1176-20130426/7888_1 /TAXON_ID=265551 /ORGANISM="Synedropsis recta cf, Strain CCMP1620" /LENGTH=207 /DNA_ID=CAMNT_0006966137 /DNA_START=24 /DNA_END=647 /DNA_ORIENTATION=+
MKVSTAVACFSVLASANGFAVVSRSPSFVSTSSALNAAGIYYSSATGNTETIAGYISKAAGDLSMDDIGDATEDEIKALDAIIVGAPTWHTGADDQRSGTSWDDWLYDTLPGLDLKDKKVAVFGCGDQSSYGDYFCDAAGELHELFAKAGCKMYGLTSTDGYDYTDSKSLIGTDKFCGLLCDEDNQYDLSEGRVTDWVAQLKTEGFF